MTSIQSVGTALPPHRYTLKDVLEVGSRWLEDQPEERALFERFVNSSNVTNRFFSVPSTEILTLKGLSHRAELFEKYAAPLGARALAAALESSSINKTDLETLVFASCTCPSIPSVDALIVENLKLPRTSLRVPIYQHGCAGGVAGLRIASELSKVRGSVALTSVELCSLVFQKDNPSSAQLVGAAIFADGAASVLLSPHDSGLVIRATQSYLIPNTRQLMGYDILDNGPHLRLDRNLPQALVESAPDQIHGFLTAHGTSMAAIEHWLFHPGGSKILEFLESTLCRTPEHARWSREVFTSLGNLSSATILFVLGRFLEAEVCKPGDKVLMLGIGPGLTLELILFEWVG